MRTEQSINASSVVEIECRIRCKSLAHVETWSGRHSLAVGAVSHGNCINVNVEPCRTLTSAPRNRMLTLRSTCSAVLEPHSPTVIAGLVALYCCKFWWRLKAYTHHVSRSARLRIASIAQEEQSFSIMWSINMRRRPRPNAKHLSNAKFVKVVNPLHRHPTHHQG
jgi:hypothetical protein